MPNGNLTEEETQKLRRQIIELREQGYGVTAIGRELGFAQSTITRQLKAIGASLVSPEKGRRISRHPSSSADRKRNKDCKYCFPNDNTARIHMEFTVELALDKLEKHLQIRGFQRSDPKRWLEEDLEIFLHELPYSDFITDLVIYINGVEEK